jgi:secondary thiamine-phosphate synthase enzyme
MEIHRDELTFRTDAETNVLDLTPQVAEIVERSGVAEGQVLVFTPGSTAGITTIEFEPGAVADLKRVFEEIAPADGEYEHNLRWGDGNGYSHVRAALLGPSLTVPVEVGRLVLGTWQQIILCDFDNKPNRRRRVVVQVTGR